MYKSLYKLIKQLELLTRSIQIQIQFNTDSEFTQSVFGMDPGWVGGVGGLDEIKAIESQLCWSWGWG